MSTRHPFHSLPRAASLRPAMPACAAGFLLLALARCWPARHCRFMVGAPRLDAPPDVPFHRGSAPSPISPHPCQDWFARHHRRDHDGLAPIPGLRVAAQVSSFNSRISRGDLHRIGVELGVAAVLQAASRKRRPLDAAVELVRAEDGYPALSATINPPAATHIPAAGNCSRPRPTHSNRRRPAYAAATCLPRKPTTLISKVALYSAGPATIPSPGPPNSRRRHSPSIRTSPWPGRAIHRHRVSRGCRQVHSNEAMPAPAMPRNAP